MKNTYAEILIRLNIAWAEFLLANFWNLQGPRFLNVCVEFRKFETFWEKVCKQP